MAAEKLPEEFDAVVLGTGICESIIAAALARVGWRVLHLDRHENYGGDWASYNFTALQQWIQSFSEGNSTLPGECSSVAELTAALRDGERLLMLPQTATTVTCLCETVHAPECGPEPDTGPVSIDEVISDTALHTATDQLSTDADALPTAADDSTDLPTDERSATDADKPDADMAATVSVGCSPTEAALDKPAADDTAVAANVECSAAEAGVSAKDDVQSDGSVEGGAEKMLKSVEQSDSEASDEKQTWYFADVKKQWRKFNMDLMPKLLYCCGSLVELLISSDVAKYCEFRSVTRVLTYINEQLEQVPCSRADVFASQNVGVVEKRMLMKLLTFCLEFDKNPDEFAGYEEKPFIEFLKSKKLTDTVRHYVQHGIAMVTDETTTTEALRATQKFLQSLGRYGNTAFLWPLYGCGELPQCFCRMCAVFGGIYCLRRQLTATVLDEHNRVVAVIESAGQRISTRYVVMEASYASSEIIRPAAVVRISRAVFITDGSIQRDKQRHITLFNLPLPAASNVSVTICELSSDSLACPDGLYIVHMTCRSLGDDARSDLQPVAQLLFDCNDEVTVSCAASERTRPRVLWSLYFNVNDSSRQDLTSAVDNILVVSGPDELIDYDHAVTEARQVFEKICPGEEFLPRAPNPEDIIYDEGQTESGFESAAESETRTDGSSESASDATDVHDDAAVANGNDDAAAAAETEADSPSV